MKLTKYIVSVFLCVTLLSGLILFFISDKKEFSENENRMLEKFPEFSFDALQSGKYLLRLEDYMKDHLPARDALMKIKTQSQIIAGFKKINGVFIGDGRLIQKIDMPDSSIFIECTNNLFSKINEDITTAVILVPTASEIYKEDLPDFAQCIDEKEAIDGIMSGINCDIKPDLITAFNNAKSGGNLFYKTDHHWTTYGGMTAYSLFLESVGKTAEDNVFDITTVSESFKGTLYSKVLDDSLNDTISRYDVSEVSFRCKSGNSPEDLKESDYFAPEYLSKKDKYAYFGNGNQPLIVLENENCKNNEEIVIVKDSFANCIAPLFTADYKKVHIIDTRYMKKPKVSEYVNSIPEVSCVLVLYGLDSLNRNSGISRIS